MIPNPTTAALIYAGVIVLSGLAAMFVSQMVSPFPKTFLLSCLMLLMVLIIATAMVKGGGLKMISTLNFGVVMGVFVIIGSQCKSTSN